MAQLLIEGPRSASQWRPTRPVVGRSTSIVIAGTPREVSRARPTAPRDVSQHERRMSTSLSTLLDELGCDDGAVVTPQRMEEAEYDAET
eukprot:scaffold52988_cov68-Phaeocystis_antarctica.AAC.12